MSYNKIVDQDQENLITLQWCVLLALAYGKRN